MNPIFSFREIETDDINEIFEVRVATWHNDNGRRELIELGITPASVATMLKQTHKGWLCQIESGIVGFAMGNKATGEMWVIAVLHEFEGRGVGKQLLSLVEAWLFENDWREIWLTTDTDEKFRAVGFYRNLGWQDWKIEYGDRFMKKIAPDVQANKKRT